MSKKYLHCLHEVEDLLKNNPNNYFTPSQIMNALINGKELHFTKALIRSICEHLVVEDIFSKIESSNMRHRIDIYRFKYDPGARQRKQDEKKSQKRVLQETLL